MLRRDFARTGRRVLRGHDHRRRRLDHPVPPRALPGAVVLRWARANWHCAPANDRDLYLRRDHDGVVMWGLRVSADLRLRRHPEAPWMAAARAAYRAEQDAAKAGDLAWVGCND